ncbi:MAG: 2-oxoacid:acceptor oxidoreductase family protein [Eubacteriales bacterium]|nr:2-oxoacid:acceptor oxidoreductase family protein [Eubacteriales bacterium]
MNKNWELIISGSGGQGAILAGIIFAEAALADGYNVIQTQSYGPEARGGASRSEVLISQEELAYPKVQNCNLMVAMTQESLDKYANMLAEDGVLLIDQDIDASALKKSIRVYKAPIFATVEKLQKPMVANILVLGILNTIAGIVKPEHLSAAIQARVPAATISTNLKALEEGIQIGKELVNA